MVINELYLNITPRIQRNYNHNTFNIDQKTSYYKINDILVRLNSLVFDIPEPPFCLLTPKDLSPPILPIKQCIDIADITLDASILSIDTIRLYICKTKRNPYYIDFEHIIFDEINRFIEEYWKEKRVRVLQIRISTIQNGFPDTKSDEIWRLIVKKLSFYLVNYINICNKINSDVLSPNRLYNHKIKFKDPSKPF